MEGLDTPKKLTEWLTRMGYEGKVPTNLKPFCNPCTALIWEQLIQTVKPKQKIEHIRNNILINRLLRNDETCSSPSIYLLKHESEYPIREIEIWNKKKKLEKQISALRDSISEAEGKLNNLSTSNKIKYMNLENIRQKVNENNEYSLLLNTKSVKLRAEKDQVEEMLTLARNLTPVEAETQNKTEVLETLKQCSAKLEKIIEKQNEGHPIPTILSTESSMEIKTPHKKFPKRNRGFASLKKSHIFTSTKISNQNRRKPKQGSDDSLGLLNDFSMSFDNALAASSFKDSNFSNVDMCYDLAILNDQELNRLTEDALHKYDRFVIWNSLLGLNEICKVQLINAIVENDKQNSSSMNVGNNDGILMKLYAIHVDYELKTIKTDLDIQEIKQEFRKLEDAIYEGLTTDNTTSCRITKLKNHLKLQQKEVGVIAAVQYLHRTVNAMRETTGKQDDLRMIREKARNVEENIVSKLCCIEHKLGVFKQINDEILEARNETCMLAKKLGQFSMDASWILPLSSNVSSVEIGTFLRFPLEYNRVITINGTKAFMRDLPLNYVPYQEDFNSNSVHMLVALLQNPCSPAETLLIDIVKVKRKMEHLQALKNVPGSYTSKGYTLEQLKEQESCIVYALDKLKSLVYTASTSKVMHILTNIREIVNFWLEMPIKDFVSPKRLFNGAPYSHYEKLYDNFYKQL